MLCFVFCWLPLTLDKSGCWESELHLMKVGLSNQDQTAPPTAVVMQGHCFVFLDKDTQCLSLDVQV